MVHGPSFIIGPTSKYLSWTFYRILPTLLSSCPRSWTMVHFLASLSNLTGIHSDTIRSILANLSTPLPRVLRVQTMQQQRKKSTYLFMYINTREIKRKVNVFLVTPVTVATHGEVHHVHQWRSEAGKRACYLKRTCYLKRPKRVGKRACYLKRPKRCQRGGADWTETVNRCLVLAGFESNLDVGKTATDCCLVKC